MVIHASRMRRCGNASTASGTSHSENCGLHTLLVNRNSGDDQERHLRQPRPLRRGQRDVSDTRTTQYEQHAITTVLSIVGGSHRPRPVSKPCQSVKDFTTLYSESMSSPRGC